jgi:uncharacterized membrane protein
VRALRNLAFLVAGAATGMIVAAFLGGTWGIATDDDRMKDLALTWSGLGVVLGVLCYVLLTATSMEAD